MELTRRAFGKLSGWVTLAFVMGQVAFTTGCPGFTEIVAWVNVGLQSFQSIVDLLSGAGVINIVIGSAIDLIIKAVKAALADIATAVNNYNAAPAASKATLLGKISTAIMVAQNSIAQFWNDLTLPDPKVAATVAGLLGIIVSTLAAFAATVPPPPATMSAVRFERGFGFPAPQKRSIAEYKRDFRAILDANGFSQYARF